MENHEVGARCFKEGLETILPFFKQLPMAFANIALGLTKDYWEASENSGIEPDEKLLGEIEAVFQSFRK